MTTSSLAAKPAPRELATEITAWTDEDPGDHYRELTAEFGAPCHLRIDAPATVEQKARLKGRSPDAVRASSLAGETITAKLGKAPGNDAPIDRVEVVRVSGWFAARPSGTEAVHKIYAESFQGEAHVNANAREAQARVNAAPAEPSAWSLPGS